MEVNFYKYKVENRYIGQVLQFSHLSETIFFKGLPEADLTILNIELDKIYSVEIVDNKFSIPQFFTLEAGNLKMAITQKIDNKIIQYEPFFVEVLESLESGEIVDILPPPEIDIVNVDYEIIPFGENENVFIEYEKRKPLVRYAGQILQHSHLAYKLVVDLGENVDADDVVLNVKTEEVESFVLSKHKGRYYFDIPYQLTKKSGKLQCGIFVYESNKIIPFEDFYLEIVETLQNMAFLEVEEQSFWQLKVDKNLSGYDEIEDLQGYLYVDNLGQPKKIDLEFLISQGKVKTVNQIEPNEDGNVEVIVLTQPEAPQYRQAWLHEVPDEPEVEPLMIIFETEFDDENYELAAENEIEKIEEIEILEDKTTDESYDLPVENKIEKIEEVEILENKTSDEDYGLMNENKFE